jgi:RimJ/RimL family protein N-acetyltransferase
MARRYEKLDLTQEAHCKLVLDVLNSNRPLWENDVDTEAFDFLEGLTANFYAGNVKGITISLKNKLVGFVAVVTDRYNCGALHGGLIKEMAPPITGFKALKAFLSLCFKTLKLNRLSSELPISATGPERMLRAMGFRKEGMMKGSMMLKGKPIYTILLAKLNEEIG